MDEGQAIAIAVPVFFALMLVELAVSRARGQSVYRLPEALACLSTGIGSQATALLWRAVPVAVYAAVEAVAPWHLDATSPWTWGLALLLVDHQYYWWHRLSHRVRLLWASHRVHHQSEDYNLAVALRQEWWGPFTHLPFQLPLALLGVPVEVWLTAELVDLLYQFWIHTELVDRLPKPLEAVLNTPSHHRVHHGVDPVYIDRNHGGILIVWDKLYGTFTEETHRPTYGTVTPLQSINPVWADLEPLDELRRDLARIPTWSGRLRHLLAPPERYPPELGGDKTIPEPVPGRLTWDVAPPLAVLRYASVHFLLVAAVFTAASATMGDSAWPLRGGLVAWLVLGPASLAGLMEGRPWARTAEVLRLAGAPVLALAVWGPGWPTAFVAILAATSGAWMTRLPRAVEPGSVEPEPAMAV